MSAAHRSPGTLAGVLLVGLMGAMPAASAAPGKGGDVPGDGAPRSALPHTIAGRAIYRNFRDGLADKTCTPGASARWKQHFAKAPQRLASRDDDALPLFGYVVDALRDAGLPTEYALIPFIESGYKPAARSPAGPTGLWQLIARTARHHRVTIHAGYDGRLSPVDSTRAAVRYLKTLHGMFGGNWQLVVMAYNAGEHRILGAVKRSGRKPSSIDPGTLQGVPEITRAYPRKLHALSCLLEQADDRQRWRDAMDRQVPHLAEVTLPDDATDLRAWARDAGQDPDLVARLNPAIAAPPRGAAGRRILAPSAPHAGE